MLDNLTLAKLRWQCRRGMLELDLLLNLFLEQTYPSLTLAEQKTFQELLEFPDPTLYAWLLAPKSQEVKPENNAMAAIIEKIMGPVSKVLV